MEKTTGGGGRVEAVGLDPLCPPSLPTYQPVFCLWHRPQPVLGMLILDKCHHQGGLDMWYILYPPAGNVVLMWRGEGGGVYSAIPTTGVHGISCRGYE